jgi:hypothetical protein
VIVCTASVSVSPGVSLIVPWFNEQLS